MTGQSPKQSSASQKPKPSPDEKKKHNNELLDEALDETFPASDAVAIIEPVHRPQQPEEKKGK